MVGTESERHYGCPMIKIFEWGGGIADPDMDTVPVWMPAHSPDKFVPHASRESGQNHPAQHPTSTLNIKGSAAGQPENLSSEPVLLPSFSLPAPDLTL